MHPDSGPTRRWLSLLLLAGALAYLGWRLVTVVADPSVAAIGLLLVEAIAWIGVAAFLAGVGRPYRPAPDGKIVDPPATIVVGVIATAHSPAALERTLASLDIGDAAPPVLVVDDEARPEVSRLAAAAGATVVPASGGGVTPAVIALANVLPEDAAVVLLESGSLLAADALDALVAPMRDATVGAVQGALDWADPATITVHGPSRDGLGVLVGRQAPAAGAAGVAPILGDGVALRARALSAIHPETTDLTVAFASAGWRVRFAATPVVYRPRPASAAQWRATRSAQVAEACRSARAAARAPGLAFLTRARIVAGAGDVASAYARIGLVVLLVAALLSGSVPIPGPLGATLVAAAALWSLATLAVHLAVDPVLQVGDRLRLGWHRLDADALAPFGRTIAGSSTAGRIRALASFPLCVVALLAVDAAAFVRGLALVRPSLVPEIPTSLARATIGIATLAVLALLVDSLRVFVARPDARTDLRVPAHIAAIVGAQRAELRDLSPTGAGLVCADAMPPGTVIQLGFTLPGGVHLALDGTVVRVERIATADGSSTHHLGVEFGAIPPETRRALVRYVATTAPGAAAAASATALPRASAVPVPRPLLRFASVLAVIVASTSLIAAPASAAPSGTTQFTGTVSGPSGPLGGICASAVSDTWQWWTAISDPSGAFTLDVPPGSYRFQFNDCGANPTPRLAGGWWSPSGLTTHSGATLLSGSDGQANDPITITLPAGGWFTGSVQDAGGVPLDGICVTPVSSTNDWDGGTNTPSNGGPAGTFETAVLIPGQYRLHVNDCLTRPEPYVGGWIGADGTTVTPFQDAARVFDVPAADLDVGTITLATGTRITGTVTDDAGTPAPGICVGAFGDNWTWVGGGYTGPDGAYTIDALPTGDWVLSFNDCNQTRTLVNALYDGTPGGTQDFNAATRVHTDPSVPQLDGYDQVMLRGGTVSGSVHSSNGPEANVCVSAVRGSGNDWQWVGGTQTGPDGSFSMSPIPPGDFAVHVSDCGNGTVLDGFYPGPGEPLTRDAAGAATLTAAPDAPITDLDITVVLGTTLSGTVTGDGAPLADACVSALDPSTGYTRGERTQASGTWHVVVPAGAYVVQAIDCVPGRGFAGRFLDDTADPAAARVVTTNPGDAITGLDLHLTSAATGSITGRLTTGPGVAPQACAVAVAPETEPAAISPTAPDGTFDLTGLNPGSYLVGFAGCDFGDNMPHGVTDPTDPSFVYPLQWSSGRTIEETSLWADPTWVTVGPGTATDIGVVCLQPCVVPDEPVAALPTDPTAAPPPPAGTPGGFAPDPAPPTGTPFPGSATLGSGLARAQQAIAPAPPVAAVEAAETAGVPTGDLGTRAIPDRARTAAATRTGGTSDGDGGGSSWWWVFVLAAAVAAVAAGVPWLRSRSAAGTG